MTVRAVVVTGAAEPPRVAYTIGRAAGGAVRRNRLRRRLRAAVWEERDALRSGVAYLVGARPAAHDLDPRSLRRDVACALRSASKALR